MQNLKPLKNGQKYKKNLLNNIFMKLTRENFSVSQIQRTKEGMKFKCGMSYTDKEGYHYDKESPERDRYPHEDFVTDLNRLKKFVGKIINYGSINRIVGDTKFKVTEDQSRYLMRLYQDLISKITINGIDLFCEDQIINHCQIKYSLSGYSSQNMDCKTYKIDLSENIHGDEQELTDLCDKLIDHSYAYIYENKAGQGDLFEQEEGEE